MRRRAAILGLVLLVGVTAARAEDSIWAALVLATNEQPAKPAPKELAPYTGGLRAVFGYNTFYLLGDKTKKIGAGVDAWIVPTKKVFLKVRSVARKENFYALQLELYVRKKVVVTSDVKLGRGAPLYIRGPAWGRGRLIFVLEVR